MHIPGSALGIESRAVAVAIHCGKTSTIDDQHKREATELPGDDRKTLDLQCDQDSASFKPRFQTAQLLGGVNSKAALVQICLSGVRMYGRALVPFLRDPRGTAQAMPGFKLMDKSSNWGPTMWSHGINSGDRLTHTIRSYKCGLLHRPLLCSCM
jgi:hypothetical protein